MPTLAYSLRARREKWSAATDRELLLAVAKADEEAFDALMERKTVPLVQLAYRIVGDREEARDVVQLAFLRVWERAGDYDDRWSPNTWIYRITTNLAIDAVRSRQRKERQAGPVRHHLVHLADAGQRREFSRLQQQEVTRILRQLSGLLSERQRLVFILREVEGLESREVAGILGCKESTVRNHLFAARRVLRRELRRKYPEYARGTDAGSGP